MDEKAFNALKTAIDQIFDHLVEIVKRLDALEARTNNIDDKKDA